MLTVVTLRLWAQVRSYQLEKGGRKKEKQKIYLLMSRNMVFFRLESR